jgi:hypothetical protein
MTQGKPAHTQNRFDMTRSQYSGQIPKEKVLAI